MTRLARLLVLCALACAGCADDTTRGPDQVGHATARRFANELIDAVDTRALRPSDPAAFAAAKERLLALVRVDGPVDRAGLYGRARALLWTLDTDGHTILWSRNERRAFAESVPVARAADPGVVDAVDTPGGIALVVAPPAATIVDPADEATYARALLRTIADSPVPARACALVVDLRRQTGGNAWPPLAVFATLVSAGNRARLVDRDGLRKPLDDAGVVRGNRDRLLPHHAPDPLERFGAGAVAVLVDGQTASAGELLAIVLAGEPNVRSFGRATYGATTANVVTSLPDGATVLLTIARYALADAPPIRGPFIPDELMPDADEATLKARAAAWAVAGSPRCRGGAAAAVR